MIGRRFKTSEGVEEGPQRVMTYRNNPALAYPDPQFPPTLTLGIWKSCQSGMMDAMYSPTIQPMLGDADKRLSESFM